jgi:O-antigen ligase
MLAVASKRKSEYLKISITKFILLFFAIYISNFLYIPASIILKIPQNIQLGAAFFIFISFSIFHIRKSDFSNLTNFKLVFFYLISSLLLTPFYYNINWWPNDMIRCILLLFLFFSLRVTFRNYYLSALKIIAIFTIVIQYLFCIPQLYFKEIYIIVMGLNTESLTRVSGSLVDPNVFSFTVCTCYIILIYTIKLSGKIKNLYIILLSLFSLYLVNLSGSRGGLLIILIVFFLYLKSVLRNTTFLAALSFLSILFFFSITNFSSSNISDQETTIDRFFSQDEKVKTYSSSSSDQRLGSLDEGFTLIKENYFLFGPGIFMYNYVWEKHNFYVFPHNTFVYLYSMFGILSLFPFYILIVLPFRNIKLSTAKKLLFVTLLFSLMLSVNVVFYPLSFMLLDLIIKSDIGELNY